MSYLFRYLGFLLILNNCLIQDHESSKFIQNFTLLSQAIYENFPDTEERQILSGNLNPKFENKLFENSNGDLFLIVNGKFDSKSSIRLTKDIFEKKGSDYILNIEFKKLKWENENLYKIKRNQTQRMGNLKPSIFFDNIAKLIRFNPINSLTQIQLCKVLLCSVEELNNNKILAYEFNESTNKKYPEFFKKYAPRFDHLNFQLTAIADSNTNQPIQIENNKRKILFYLPLDGAQVWKTPKKIEFILDFSMKTYGVTFQVKNMRYIINHKFINNGEFLTGKFVDTPHHTLDGRFFYVIPQGVVDFFIPGNIEEYIKKGLILVTVGTDGKSGNQFTAKYIGNGNSAFVKTEFRSEVYQKRFSLFGNTKESKNLKEGDIDSFVKDLWKEIAKDLHHSSLN
jgi:hypothetical protein